MLDHGGGTEGSRKFSKEHLIACVHTLHLCQAQFVLDHDIITGHWPYTRCCGMRTEPRKIQLWKESPTKAYRHANREQHSGSSKESTGLQTEIFSSIEKCKYISRRKEEECVGGGNPEDPVLNPQCPVLPVYSSLTWFQICSLTKMEFLLRRSLMPHLCDSVAHQARSLILFIVTVIYSAPTVHQLGMSMGCLFP